MSIIDDVVAKASIIPGWMFIPDLTWLATLASTRSVGIEVGCWKGRSTLVMGHHVLEKLYAVDHWRGNRENLNDVHREAVERGPDGLYQIFYDNVRYLVDSGKVVPVRNSSVDAAKLLLSEKGKGWADFVFLDGGHSDEEVTRDIYLYSLLIKKDGVLCGHDAPYVTPTLNRLFGKEWHVTVGDIWKADMNLELLR